MLLNDEVQMLRRLPLFAGVETSKLKLLAFASDRLGYDPGEILFLQGDNADAAYVILEGKADIIVESPRGPITVAEVESNSIVGEIGILCDMPRTATVKAISHMEVLRIKREHFLRLLHEYPNVTVQIMRVLAERLQKTTSELSDSRSRAS